MLPAGVSTDLDGFILCGSCEAAVVTVGSWVQWLEDSISQHSSPSSASTLFPPILGRCSLSRGAGGIDKGAPFSIVHIDQL